MGLQVGAGLTDMSFQLMRCGTDGWVGGDICCGTIIWHVLHFCFHNLAQKREIKIQLQDPIMFLFSRLYIQANGLLMWPLQFIVVILVRIVQPVPWEIKVHFLGGN